MYMIKMLRIDDRLIHGQVAVVWAPQLGVDGIVVANDEVLNDQVQLMSMKMAVPTGMKLAVRSVEDAIKLLNNPKAEKMKLLVLVRNPKDCLKIVKNVDNIPFVNFGNYGRIKQDDCEREKFTPDIFISDKDIPYLSDIIDTGIKFVAQVVPEKPEKSVKKLLEGFKKEH